MEDHDQRFKFLLAEFLGDFLRLALPEEWVRYFDVAQAEWLPQEAFLDPPQGEHRHVDLLVRIPTTEPIVMFDDELSDECIVLIHIEIESGESSRPVKKRVTEYRAGLRNRYDLSVIPIVLFLKVGLEGLGWMVRKESILGVDLGISKIRYVGLPALDGTRYLEGENLLGVALASLMNLPAERRAELKMVAMRRITASEVNAVKKYLLAEAVEAYLTLNAEQTEEYKVFEESDEMEEIRVLKNPWTDRARAEERRELIQRQLEEKFGPLPEGTLVKLKAASGDQLLTWATAFWKADSLAELGLDD